jgi:hypothetical protein
MKEALTNTPVIVVGIMIGVDLVLRILERIGKLRERAAPAPTTEEIPPIEVEIPKSLLKQSEDTYWTLMDVYRHVKESEKMLEKIREKLPQGMEKIAELMQEMLLELKKISKELEKPNGGDK